MSKHCFSQYLLIFLLSPLYFLLEVNICFGCVEKEKDLPQTANKWAFSAEHLFIWQLGTCRVGSRDNWVELDFAEPREELRALQAALCAWAIPTWLCPWIHIWYGPSWIPHPSHFLKKNGGSLHIGVKYFKILCSEMQEKPKVIWSVKLCMCNFALHEY